MLSALIRKELFQCSGFCLVALLTCAALPSWLYDPNRPEFPPFTGGFSLYFVGLYSEQLDALVANFSLVGGVLAVVIGLIQSAWESITGTWHFLLYRPASRQKILAIKLVTGTCLLLICTAIPGLAYGIWASTPGTHNSPFGWDMTLGFWQQWLTIPILYLAAFQSGLLDARWYGTRLLPVAAAGALCVLLAIVPHWWFIGLPITCVTVTVQTLTLFHSMQVRDFA
ncbi:MAG: hypothetical protein U0936_19370 [Planctomycetaceae bacterium]